jgi:hypothetical protein
LSNKPLVFRNSMKNGICPRLLVVQPGIDGGIARDCAVEAQKFDGLRTKYSMH